ncbi:MULTISPECIES: leucine-rich repeat domain-containing protein [Glycomyces]|uniref:non-specific serine/threonine protein kinase n=2 Tax=Glycomyces TaxID=58113 RepID=A0A9X3TA29_9ACTN|nr:COR domain-containing protein [Glycomyces lechevalierae]MDA1387208.1 ADP-ribosylation factor-like protein [Glycomyces lechevalierae]MDR7338528.1 Leucine-rich repeat (LRR) protein [Glycomyces lechevalierae]
MLDEAMQRIQEAKRTRQTVLDLSAMDLTELPEEVCEMTWLTGLILVSNQLSSLPESIGNLTRLIELRLFGNRLTALPESIGRLRALTILDLGYNRLTALPESIGDLTALEDLNLTHNNLVRLPDTLVDLRALTVLDLGQNDLEALPEAIGNLTELALLDLEGNDLRELPESVGSLTLLLELDLSANRLTALPESVGGLASLWRLDFNGNRLTELPESIGELRKLTELNCSSNNLGYLPDSICGLAHLIELDLDANDLSALPERIGDLGRLTGLGLHNNRLTALPSSFGDLTALTEIGLIGNRITSLPDSITRCTAVEEIHLLGNRLERLPESIGDLTAVRVLSLRDNDLQCLPESIGNLTALEDLDAWGCTLDALPESIGSLSSLVQLNVAFNRISEVPESIGNLTALTKLDLSFNQVALLPDSIGGLTALTVLDLRSNELSSLPESIGNLVELRTLDANENALSALPESIGNLDSLRKLNLERNHLSALPSTLARLPGLTELPVGGNPFSPEVAAVSDSGHEGLMTFLKEIATDGVDVREAKLVVVGEGAVGKSTLLAAMMGEPFEEDRDSTHGIEVKPLVLAEGNSEECVLNAWDFGGQPTYRPTHQLFFTAPAVYLVVWKPRHGPRRDNVEEWIELIRRRAGDEVRVHVVATHGGPKDRFAHIDEASLRQAHGQVIAGFHQIDSRTGEGIEALKAAVRGTASRLPHFERKLPGSWRRFQDSQRRSPEPYLEYGDYLARAAEHGLTETSARTLATVATDLGHWCHYPNIPGLNQLVVLKGDWLSAAVSLVIDDAQTVRDHGLIEHSSLKEIWDDPSNPSHLRDPEKVHRVLLRLMEKYEISYRVSGGHGGRPPTSLIAQLVDPSTPPLDRWEHYGRGLPVQSRILKFSDASGNFHLPEGLIYRLIVRLHQFSLGRERYEQSLHWTGGLVIDHGMHGRALIKLQRNQLMVAVKAVAPEYLLTMIVEEIRAHVGEFWQGVKIHTLVSCGGHCNDPAGSREGQWDLERLFNRRLKGKHEISCGSCDEDVSIQELLSGVAVPSTSEERFASAVTGALDERFDLQAERIRQGGFQSGGEMGNEMTSLITRAESYLQDMLKGLEGEAVHGPRLFTLDLMGRNEADRPSSAAATCKVTLWCEYSRKPVWTFGPDPLEGIYALQMPTEWLFTAASWINAMSVLLNVALPDRTEGMSPYVSQTPWRAIEEQVLYTRHAFIDARQIGREDLTSIGDVRPDMLLRQLHASIRDSGDQGLNFGGLVRVRNRGRYLWVHPRFEAELNPGLPEMGSGSTSDV